MIRIKPILPCQSIKEQVSFYESLGFNTIQIYTRPNPYAVVSYGSLELHIYGTKRDRICAESGNCSNNFNPSSLLITTLIPPTTVCYSIIHNHKLKRIRSTLPIKRSREPSLPPLRTFFSSAYSPKILL